MAASGLVRADGSSGKPDYDKVNELLLMLTPPLSAELSARLDPSMSDGDGSLADPATFQMIVGWRERAWRNAEDLATAVDDVERELVAQRIEDDALAEGLLLLEANSYLLPLTTTEPRDEYCAVHNQAEAAVRNTHGASDAEEDDPCPSAEPPHAHRGVVPDDADRPCRT